MLTRILVSALALVATASAAPSTVLTRAVAPANFDRPNVLTVYDPPITAPAAGDVWTAGTNQTVKWDASRIGADGQNTTARLLLGHRDAGTENEYLDISKFALLRISRQ